MKYQNKILKYLKKIYKDIFLTNRCSPFPLYDTEYVGLIKNKIETMKDNEMDYDSLPVACCKYCKHLHSLVDEDENVICTRCGSVNEEIIFENFEAYQKHVKENETD